MGGWQKYRLPISERRICIETDIQTSFLYRFHLVRVLQMDAYTFLKFLVWSARINAIAEITSFIALILFFARGGFWGKLNDSLSVVWALSMVPLAWWFFKTNLHSISSLNTIFTVLGVGSMLLFALFQGALVVGLVRYEQTVRLILTLIGIIGAWMLENGFQLGIGRVLPTGLILVMLVFGLGLFLSSVGFWLGGERHPLTAIGFFIGSLAGMIWPIWLAKKLIVGME